VQLVCFDLKRKLVPAGLVERQARTYALTKAGAKLVKNI
jgi:predicted transcriptional regulator